MSWYYPEKTFGIVADYWGSSRRKKKCQIGDISFESVCAAARHFRLDEWTVRYILKKCKNDNMLSLREIYEYKKRYNK